jgi:hypothetical protein
MEYVKAFAIVSQLADGKHPFSGELLPAESPYNEAEVIRALMLGAGLLNQRAQWELRKKSLPENSGKQWSAEEDQRLAREFDEGIAPIELAKRFKRSIGSIEVRLVRIGKIDEASLTFPDKIQRQRPVFKRPNAPL